MQGTCSGDSGRCVLLGGVQVTRRLTLQLALDRNDAGTRGSQACDGLPPRQPSRTGRDRRHGLRVIRGGLTPCTLARTRSLKVCATQCQLALCNRGLERLGWGVRCGDGGGRMLRHRPRLVILVRFRGIGWGVRCGDGGARLLRHLPRLVVLVRFLGTGAGHGLVASTFASHGCRPLSPGACEPCLGPVAGPLANDCCRSSLPPSLWVPAALR